SLLLPLFIGGCLSQSRSSTWRADSGKVKILSTIAQIGDLVEDIGGERVDSLVLIQGDLDPHSYEIVKGDAEKIGQADLIFYNGLGLEHGASLFSMLRSAPKATAVGDQIRHVHPEKILHKEGAVDPHIWMDISLWKEGIDPIVQALSEKDPQGAPYYQERGLLLKEKMEQAHADIRQLMQNIPSKQRYLVTSHDAFHYFTRSYLADPGEADWEGRFAAPEGLAPEGQLNSKDIQKIIAYLKAKEVRVLFPESNVSRDAIRKIATAGQEMGLDIRICSEPLYGDAMSHLRYLEMMHKNAETIAKYL
ncbi:MAG: zinc ABC transporter substrate-binding protein, partial [Verrucomicrobia bacterium]|nr:zinc ABC transporter substrate-binding protein [Verrucomicrobiota bacterium]